MSNNEPDDESTTDSQPELEHQAAENDAPSAQSAGQSSEQGDQFAAQSEEQPAESDQSAGQSDKATGGGGGGGGSGGGVGGVGSAADAVAADSGAGSKRDLKVIVEFTQEGGQKFLGDIKLSVYEYDNQKGKQGRKLFGGDVYDWQLFDAKTESTIIASLSDVASPDVAINAAARVTFGITAGVPGYQSMYAMEVFGVPRGDALRVKADVELENVSENVDAPNADKAKGMVTQLPKFEGKLVVQLFAKLIGRQYFRVTGKVYAGHIFLRRVTE